MNFDQYFKMRADFAMRIMADTPPASPPDGGWRFFGAGVGTLVVAIAAELWIARTQVDPGFFAVTSAFLKLVLLAGIGLLGATLASEVAMARLSIKLRESLKQKAFAQVQDLDGAVAAKLAERSGGR